MRTTDRPVKGGNEKSKMRKLGKSQEKGKLTIASRCGVIYSTSSAERQRNHVILRSIESRRNELTFSTIVSRKTARTIAPAIDIIANIHQAVLLNVSNRFESEKEVSHRYISSAATSSQCLSIPYL